MNAKVKLGWVAGLGLLLGGMAVACGGDDDAELSDGDNPTRCGDDASRCASSSSSGDLPDGTSSGGGSSGASGGASSSGGSSSGEQADAGRVPRKHRAEPVPCDNVRSEEDPDVPPDVAVQCRTHAECTEGTNGRCRGNGRNGWQCTYDACTADDECGGSAVCECEGGFQSDHNVCLESGCRVDADCGANGFCSPSEGSCGRYMGTVTYQCHTPEDECVDDEDCDEGSCRFDSMLGHWACSNVECAG